MDIKIKTHPFDTSKVILALTETCDNDLRMHVSTGNTGENGMRFKPGEIIIKSIESQMNPNDVNTFANMITDFGYVIDVVYLYIIDSTNNKPIKRIEVRRGEYIEPIFDDEWNIINNEGDILYVTGNQNTEGTDR